MSSLVTAVLKSFIGALISKGRSLAAKKLKDGDVADVKIRQLIVQDMDDIKSKLDEISRKDLKTSISFFNDGVVYLGKVLDTEIDGSGASEWKEVTTEVRGATKEIKVKENNVVSSAKRMKILRVDINEEATKVIEEAKSRFEDARKKAIEAFSNPALYTSDRLLAMAIRIMATVLEKVDNPGSALDSLRYCLEELHSLPAVQENFSVTLKKGFKSKFGQDQRNEIISSVCHMNRIIYDLTHEFVEDGSKSKQLLIWPCIEVDGEKIDLLRDARIAEGLREMGMEQYCVQPWSFSQKGKEEEQLEQIQSIAINTKGQFIVGDQSTINVFDRRGNFLSSFSPPGYNVAGEYVAVDHADNVYILVPDCMRTSVLYVFDAQAKFVHSFRVSTGRRGYLVHSLMVDCNGNVLMSMRTNYGDCSRPKIESLRVEVLSKSGYRLRSIDVSCGGATSCLCTTGEGRLFILAQQDSILHSYSIEDNSDYEEKPIQLENGTDHCAMKFHQPSEHFFVLSALPLIVSMYNKNCECVRTIPLNVGSEFNGIPTSSFAVDNDGHIVVGIMTKKSSKQLVGVV
ncbi:uncharacterized protein LOC111319059 [Stylophora pistillata]|uniref:Uncharacterized protein n=1 Tax=Stylophora pistillata TaxID=50429 RepID=A0A2B4R435_STYPI|nr:uncharacterized protein LOC111319059 [Stylophora pistillata]PFX11916.1 hypothetical protein AWC38_SpisGene24206 [Stylophora pistillata]